MTEKQIKEMYLGIINNGEKWEYRHKDMYGNYLPWKPYKLGDEVHKDYEYRKVEKWYVYGEMGIEPFISNEERYSGTILFTGSKEECEELIKEHTKKTWLEERIDLFDRYYQDGSRNYTDDTLREITTEICKKILDEVEKLAPMDETVLFSDIELKKIIKDLGIEL